MLYNGLEAKDLINADVKPPSSIASGDWYFHLKAYDQQGTLLTASLEEPITIDNDPPTVTVTPNGYGRTNNLTVEVTMRDNFPAP